MGRQGYPSELRRRAHLGLGALNLETSNSMSILITEFRLCAVEPDTSSFRHPPVSMRTYRTRMAPLSCPTPRTL